MSSHAVFVYAALHVHFPLTTSHNPRALPLHSLPPRPLAQTLSWHAVLRHPALHLHACEERVPRTFRV